MQYMLMLMLMLRWEAGISKGIYWGNEIKGAIIKFCSQTKTKKQREIIDFFKKIVFSGFLKYFCKILHNSINMLRRLRSSYYAPTHLLRTYYAPITHLTYYAPVTRLSRTCYGGYAGITQVLCMCYGGYGGVTQVLRKCYAGVTEVTQVLRSSFFSLRKCLRRSVTTRNFDV